MICHNEQLLIIKNQTIFRNNKINPVLSGEFQLSPNLKARPQLAVLSPLLSIKPELKDLTDSGASISSKRAFYEKENGQ